MHTIDLEFQHLVALFLGQSIPTVGLLLRLYVGLGQSQFLLVHQTKILQTEEVQVVHSSANWAMRVNARHFTFIADNA
jgi:hypothetical protein